VMSTSPPDFTEFPGGPCRLLPGLQWVNSCMAKVEFDASVVQIIKLLGGIAEGETRMPVCVDRQGHWPGAFVPLAAVQLSPRILALIAPLFKEKRPPKFLALIADPPDPLGQHRSTPLTGFSPYDDLPYSSNLVGP
jgi:hypothetical protein